MDKKPNLLICGNYGATNLGDEAILKSILQYTYVSFSKPHVTVVSSDPALTAKQFNVQTVPMIPCGFRSLLRGFFGGGIRQTLKAYKQADGIIFGGGGLFSDEKPSAIFIWVMQILPALWYKKPVFCFGQSVGPLMMRTSRRAVQFVFKRMKIITVRDDASRQILNKLGVQNIHVLPDPVFGLHSGKLSHPVGRKSQQPYLVFSLRPWMKNARKIHGILAEFADWVFTKYRIKTCFIPFQKNHDNDEHEMLQVMAKLRNRDAAEVLSFNENIEDILKLMQESVAVVGMRLHSIIFSTLTHTPFLALSYSLKVAEVVKQLQMEDYYCEYRFVDLETLKQKFEKLFDQREHVEKDLTKIQHELAQKTEKYSELLREFLSAT